MSNKAKKLSMKKVFESVEHYNESIRIDFDDDTYLTLFPFISPVNVTKILQTLGEDLNKFSEIGIELDEKLYDDYIVFCILKVQSDIPKPIDAKKNIQFFKAFINSPYYLEIVKHIDTKEIKKVYDKLWEVQLENAKFQRLMEKKVEEIKNYQFQNEELRERVLGVKENIPKI